jgi:hypothetical protein
MGGERVINSFTNELGSIICIEPPVETFEQFLDVNAAVYGVIHGEETYARESIPKPTEAEFEESIKQGRTEIRFRRAIPYEIEMARQCLSEVLDSKYGIPTLVKLSDAA